MFPSVSRRARETKMKNQTGTVPNERCFLLKNKRKIDHKTTSHEILLERDDVTLRTEKNGIKIQKSFYKVNKDCSCPVKMLPQIVTDIMKHSSDTTILTCACKYGNYMAHVSYKNISKILKDEEKET